MPAPAYPPAYLLAIWTDFVTDLRESGKPDVADWWEKTLASETPLAYGDGALDLSRNVSPTVVRDALAEFDKRMRDLGHGKALDEVAGGGIEGGAGQGPYGAAHLSSGSAQPSDLDPQPRPAKRPRKPRSEAQKAAWAAKQAREKAKADAIRERERTWAAVDADPDAALERALQPDDDGLPQW